jgi:cytochrome c biogenesis protein CcmG/thiol:disulfide interchange protein DsbE
MSSNSRWYGATALLALSMIGAAWLGRDRFQPVGPGVQAPAFQLEKLDGPMVALSDYRGSVVLVNIWATWCAPCREEMPSMQRLYDDFEGRPFEILAVSVDAPMGQRGPDGRLGGDIRRFVDEFGLTFPILHDPSGEIQRDYQTTGVPESFLVGPDGVIYRKIAGATQWDSSSYREQIERLLDA